MDRIVRLVEVCRLTGMSKSSLRRAQIAGSFPMRRSLGKRACGWRLSEVSAWISGRAIVDGAADGRAADTKREREKVEVGNV